MTTSFKYIGSALLAGFLIMGGCRQEMADQPRFEAYESSELFPDSMAMRQPVEGTVPRHERLLEAYRPNTQHVHGPEADGHEHESEGYPFEITERVLHRGRQRYDIYCAPCHGRAGYGRGIVVERGLRPPPSFHSERLRAAPATHIYEVITNGFGAMYSYASRVSPPDRWAIAAYIQSLQLSQHADVSAVPRDSLSHLQER